MNLTALVIELDSQAESFKSVPKHPHRKAQEEMKKTVVSLRKYVMLAIVSAALASAPSGAATAQPGFVYVMTINPL